MAVRLLPCLCVWNWREEFCPQVLEQQHGKRNRGDGDEQEEIPTGSEIDHRNEAGGPRGPGSSCP